MRTDNKNYESRRDLVAIARITVPLVGFGMTIFILRLLAGIEGFPTICGILVAAVLILGLFMIIPVIIMIKLEKWAGIQGDDTGGCK